MYSRYTSPKNSTKKTKSFYVTFKNPCLDTDFVQIVAPELFPYEFFIGDVNPLKFSHEPFEIITMPITHTLCAGWRKGSARFTVTPRFDNFIIDEADEPVSYDNRQFRVYTDYSEDYLN